MLTCKKRKRSIFYPGKTFTSENIEPATSLKSPDEESEEKNNAEEKNNDDTDLVSGMEISQKEGRFLNYWLTTTITTTYTTYTGTSSVASLICTPADYTNAGCPGTG